MLNKKEVEYNAMSLVSAWLFDTKDITDLRLVFSGKDKEKIIPCTVDNAGQELANILYNNKEGYVYGKLIGKNNKEEKVFGELDIN